MGNNRQTKKAWVGVAILLSFLFFFLSFCLFLFSFLFFGFGVPLVLPLNTTLAYQKKKVTAMKLIISRL